jgi:DNA-binding PadR family transcriptional regulator
MTTQFQQDVLLALSQQSMSSVTAFAKQLEMLRPSLSRMLHDMQRKGLVQCNERVWSITETGKQALAPDKDHRAVYDEQIYPLITKITRIAKRYNLPFLAAFDVNDWLVIEKHNIAECSELRCAYGELVGWSEDV